MKKIQNEQVLSGAELLHRVEDCSAKGLCFISLRSLEKNSKNVDFNGIKVSVLAQYVK